MFYYKIRLIKVSILKINKIKNFKSFKLIIQISHSLKNIIIMIIKSYHKFIIIAITEIIDRHI